MSDDHEHGHCPHCDACVPAYFDVLVKRDDPNAALPGAYAVPGIGIELARKIRELYPDTRVAVRFFCPYCGGQVVAEKDPEAAGVGVRPEGQAAGVPRSIH